MRREKYEFSALFGIGRLAVGSSDYFCALCSRVRLPERGQDLEFAGKEVKSIAIAF